MGVVEIDNKYVEQERQEGVLEDQRSLFIPEGLENRIEQQRALQLLKVSPDELEQVNFGVRRSELAQRNHPHQDATFHLVISLLPMQAEGRSVLPDNRRLLDERDQGGPLSAFRHDRLCNARDFHALLESVENPSVLLGGQPFDDHL